MKIDRFYTGFKADYDLNPMQEEAWVYNETTDNNLVVAKTASGKTACTYMYGAKYIEAGVPILYIGSLKALVNEKTRDTEDPDHPWNKVPQAIVTGDFLYDDDKIEEVTNALFVTITPEALLSKIRNISSVKNAWIKKIGLCVVDEIHLLGDTSRGHNLEVMLVKLAEICPYIQFVGLSGTVPNSTDIQKFMSGLNNKATHVVKSDYRSVPVDYHFIPIS